MPHPWSPWPDPRSGPTEGEIQIRVAPDVDGQVGDEVLVRVVGVGNRDVELVSQVQLDLVGDVPVKTNSRGCRYGAIVLVFAGGHGIEFCMSITAEKRQVQLRGRLVYGVVAETGSGIGLELDVLELVPVQLETKRRDEPVLAGEEVPPAGEPAVVDVGRAVGLTEVADVVQANPGHGRRSFQADQGVDGGLIRVPGLDVRPEADLAGPVAKP